MYAEHNGVRERLEAAETRAEGLEAAVSNSRAEQGLWKAKTEGAQQQVSLSNCIATWLIQSFHSSLHLNSAKHFTKS